MHQLPRFLALAAVAGATLLSACSGDFMDDPMSPDGASLNTTDVGYVNVAKIGATGTFAFEASESPETGSLLHTSFTLEGYPTYADNIFTTIWQQPNSGMNSNLTITEVPVTGIQVDSINVRLYTDGTLTAVWTEYDTNTVTIDGLNSTNIAWVKFFNSEIPDMGGEGCTPGFWRQAHHFDSWVGYEPSDLFDGVFGVSYGGTLYDAVWAHGGGVDALARHSVAALLNATSPEVDYPATEAEVISAVQAAFLSGDYEDQKDTFEMWNEAGCMLD